MEPQTEAAGRRSGVRGGWLLGLASLVLLTLAAEQALRWLEPELRPIGDIKFSPESGLVEGWFETRLRALRESPPDVVFIGDSFVDTGNHGAGWITRLRDTTGRRFEALAVGGACPSQYWFMLDHLRRAGIDAPVVLVLYVGNDFYDEAIWSGMRADRSPYLISRAFHLADASRPSFWPCLNAFALPGRLDRMKSTLQRHSALYRAALITGARLRSLSTGQTRGVAEQLMIERCDKPPFAEWANARLFFFRHHDATLSQDNPEIAAARAAILRDLTARKDDPNLSVAVVLDREETCAAVHGRSVERAAPFIDEVRSVAYRVLDPNPDMTAACAQRELYLPDGHWNPDGHAVFADAMRRLLTEQRILGDRPPAPAQRRGSPSA